MKIMPRKVVFTKEQIKDLAFKLVDEEGMDHLSIRQLAKALKSSVAPIYSNFKDFIDLREAVIEEINQKALVLAKQTQTGDPLKDIGAASIRFAIKHPKLFQDYIFGKYVFKENDDLNVFVLESIKKDIRLQSLPEGLILSYLEKMRIYQIGISVLASSSTLNHHSELELNQMLEEASQAFIHAVQNEHFFNREQQDEC